VIKAIIFDCFGVLVGHGFWSVYESLGGDLEKDEAFIEEQLNKADIGETSSQEFNALISERLGISLESYKHAFAEDEVPNEGVFQLIQDVLAPKYSLALVSNATGDSVRSKISADKLALFKEVFISGEVGLLKPDPELFMLALSKLGVKPDEAIFVDDHQKYIDGATVVGMHTILFTDLSTFKTKLQEYEKLND
jgi:HAD superfamily hydrolase (TIGR01509 family)